MLLLTTYMDETGHSRHERQKLNGMGGLTCKADNWETFERGWGRMLDRFEIPYIHMSESCEMFDGWSNTRIEALSKAAWDKIENIKPLPIGSIIPMDEFRRAEEKFRDFFEDPYFIAMQDCMREIVLGTLTGTELFAKMGRDHDIRAAMVFSDQIEFRHDALRMFEALKEWLPPNMRDKIYPPDFRDMRDGEPYKPLT